MIVGACGFGSTGSSVISDYLSEYENVCTIDGVEFTWASEPDGLIDLKNHVMCPHNRTSDSIVAIKRYYEAMEKFKFYYKKSGNLDPKIFKKSVNEFIDSISTVKWNGFFYENCGYFKSKFKVSLLERRIVPFIERKKGHRICCYPMNELVLSVKPNEFDQKAKRHIKELLIAMGANFDKMVVLDQPFAGNNPQACFPFYEDPYAIIVDRDPRDNYVFARTKLLGRNYFMPTEPVEDFIKYYRALRENQPYREQNDRILRLQFEELVYDYDIATEKIRNFLKLPQNPHPKSVFDPSLSINNTQVWKRYPQFLEDIKKIENELSEFLFDFERYGDVKIEGEMFFGKSPLHK